MDEDQDEDEMDQDDDSPPVVASGAMQAVAQSTASVERPSHSEALTHQDIPDSDERMSDAGVEPGPVPQISQTSVTELPQAESSPAAGRSIETAEPVIDAQSESPRRGEADVEDKTESPAAPPPQYRMDEAIKPQQSPRSPSPTRADHVSETHEFAGAHSRAEDVDASFTIVEGVKTEAIVQQLPTPHDTQLAQAEAVEVIESVVVEEAPPSSSPSRGAASLNQQVVSTTTDTTTAAVGEEEQTDQPTN
ncbi:hypothetical protein Micbo1qcDRAFT_160949, partial [Microdochium bolleyi]